MPTKQPANVSDLQEKYNLTAAEADVVMRRTDGKGDLDEAARQIRSERVGPAAWNEPTATGKTELLAETPLTPPGDWPGPQGTDLPHPDQQVERLKELAEAGVRVDNDPAADPKAKK